MDDCGLDEKFRKVERLRRRAQFLNVQRRGRRFHGPNLVMVARPNGLVHSRLGVTVSKKVGNSPRRSRWKRVLREAFRRHKPPGPVGLDLVLIVKPSRQDLGAQATADEFSMLLQKARAFFGQGS